MPEKKTKVASYEDVSTEYLEKRRLRKSAGSILLWALGVGAVISGDYYGWSYGLAFGGFLGLGVATLLMALMYLCMVYTIAELTAALPHAGGFYSFVRNALGPTAGFVCGVTDTIEYVITPAVIVVGISAYLENVVEGIEINPVACWLVFYVAFVAINIRGVEITLKAGLTITVCAVAVLVVFYLSAILSGAFEWELLFNIEPSGGNSRWLPEGPYGIFAALPYAIWFYLAIEQLPLAAEETNDVVRDMPRAMLAGIATLLVLSLLTLVLNTGVGDGAKALVDTDRPLVVGFQAVFGSGWLTSLFTLIALTGLVASFHTIIFAYGRVLFALSRAGYFPRWMSVVNANRTPQRALLLGALVGFACAVAIKYSTAAVVGAVLLSMAVFGAVISYALVMLSYIVLRLKRPDLERPYKSPLGVPGAAVGMLLSVVALAATFADKEIVKGVRGVALFLLIAIVYYAVYSRKRLVAQAPEEEAALIAKAESELGSK